MAGIQTSYDATASLISYWSTLNLALASGTELSFMGILAGFPRPDVPPTFLTLNQFLFGAAAGWETLNPLSGLGDVNNGTIGGQLGSSLGASNNPMPDSWYRLMVPLMAALKYYGITLYTVDLLMGTIAALQGTTYVLAYSPNGDITCTFAVDIAYPALWILQQAFNYYETDCVVTVINP
jgi:hypothetical protein